MASSEGYLSDGSQSSSNSDYQKYVRLVVMPKAPKRVIFLGLMKQWCIEDKRRLLDFADYNDRVLDDELKGNLGRHLSNNGSLVKNANSRNKYWVPVRDALGLCQKEGNFMLVVTPKFDAY
jgi:hypothetical protein